MVRSLIQSGSRKCSSSLYTAAINCDSDNTSVPIALGISISLLLSYSSLPSPKSFRNLAKYDCSSLSPTATMIEKCLALITHHYRHIGGDLNCFPLETLASDVMENYALSFMTILANQRVDTESPTTIDDLNVGQKEVFDKFLELIDAGNGGVIFLDAPGGTGKTFLLNFILDYVRRTRGEILATASSDIAATLLTQGKTVHSTFNVPLNIINKDNPSCALSRSSPKAIAIGISKAIIIDEAPMLHKKVYHAIDFSLKDVLDNDTLFGGKPILMSGDFRQILPIIIGGHRADTVNATIKRSYIWPSVEVMKLKTNMRVQAPTYI